jgi:hypothetical protein
MSVPYVTRLDGPSPEREVSRDIAKRGLMATPVLVALCGAIWGMAGVWSCLFGIAIVIVNFLLSAALLAFAARISLGLMMGVALFGYLIRLGLIFLAVFLVRDASWISLIALGLTIIVTHLGLLIWELRYISASLAYPGLKPNPANPAHAPTN